MSHKLPTTLTSTILKKSSIFLSIFSIFLKQGVAIAQENREQSELVSFSRRTLTFKVPATEIDPRSPNFGDQIFHVFAKRGIFIDRYSKYTYHYENEKINFSCFDCIVGVIDHSRTRFAGANDRKAH